MSSCDFPATSWKLTWAPRPPSVAFAAGTCTSRKSRSLVPIRGNTGAAPAGEYAPGDYQPGPVPRQRDAEVVIEPDDRLEVVLVLVDPESAVDEHDDGKPGRVARHHEVEALSRICRARDVDHIVDLVDDILGEVRFHRAVA